MSRFKFTKTTLALAVSATTISLFGISSLRAEAPIGGDPSGFLAIIASNTTAIANSVNNLPALIDNLGLYVKSWLQTKDASGYSGNLAANFTSFGSQLVNSTLTTPNTMLDSLTQDYFNGTTKETNPDVNDVDFETLLGKPFLTPDPRANDNPNINPSYNFIKNVSGLMVTHQIPNLTGWHGNVPDRLNYNAYYKTMVAAQTANGYLFSQIYNDVTNSFSTAQVALLKIATANEGGTSGANFLTTIGSEDLGLVARQLLMFASQSYVLQLELLQTERQLLQAQAIGNSIAIAGNIGGESILLTRAVKQVQT